MYERRRHFQEHLKEAEVKSKSNTIEGIRLYRRLLSEFDPTYDSWFDYYTAKIDMCALLKDNKEYAQGRGKIEGILKEVEQKSIESRLNKKNQYIIKYSATHSLAKLELAFSYLFSPLEHYVSYRKALNESFQNFKQALHMIISALLGFIDRGEEIEDYWSQEYLKIKCNYLQLILQEGEEFKLSTSFQNIFAEVDKGKKFLKILYSKEAEIHLYRCFYYQATSFKVLDKLEQSYRLLLEDYQFQLENNQEVDAQKSRKELMQLCLHLNKIQQAEKYTEKQNRKFVYDLSKRREKIREHFAQSPDALRKCTKDTYYSLFEDFDEELNYFRYDFIMMDKYLTETLDHYKKQHPVKALLYYYLAECNYRIGNYHKAEDMITQALKIPNSDEMELRDWRIEELMIQAKITNNKESIYERIQSLCREIAIRMRQQRNELLKAQFIAQQKNLMKIEKEFQKFQFKAKDNAYYTFESQEESELLNRLERYQQEKKNRQREKERERERDRERRAVFVENVESSSLEENYMSEENFREHIPRRSSFNPEQDYKTKCLSLGLPFRQVISNYLKTGNIPFNPYLKFYNMPPQELIQLLPLIKICELDLRNHMVNDQVMAAIASMPNNTIIKSFKLNGNNHLSNKAILETLAKMRALQELTLVNFAGLRHRAFHLLDKNQLRNRQREMDVEQQPRSLVHMLLLVGYIPPTQFNPVNLRVLKLKYCNLADEHLKQLDFDIFSSLQEVSLSHNLLIGTELGSILNLPKIKKINLSDNPLQTLSKDSWISRFLDEDFHLSTLKLKGIHLSESLGDEIYYILQKTNMVDLSQCSSLSSLISLIWKYFLNGMPKLDLLQVWKMQKVSQFPAMDLINLLSFCPNLKFVDLRFCSWNPQDFYEMLEQLKTQNIQIKLSQNNMNPQIPRFDLLPTKK